LLLDIDVPFSCRFSSTNRIWTPSSNTYDIASEPMPSPPFWWENSWRPPKNLDLCLRKAIGLELCSDRPVMFFYIGYGWRILDVMMTTIWPKVCQWESPTLDMHDMQQWKLPSLLATRDTPTSKRTYSSGFNTLFSFSNIIQFAQG
jgi:hypothetical protein